MLLPSPRREIFPPKEGGNCPCLRQAGSEPSKSDGRSDDPTQLFPIEVSIRCFSAQLPIEVPAGSVRDVVVLNKLRNKGNSPTYEIDNTSGSATLLWPPDGRRDLSPENAGRNISRCDITNHGRANLVSLTLPVETGYGRWAITQIYTVRIVPLDRGATASIYFVNECPVDTEFKIPTTGSAQVAGEATAREFRLEIRDSEGYQLGPAKTNPIGDFCG